MATFTIDEALKRIQMMLDIVANDAQAYMKDYIKKNTDNPTGKLEGSIYNEKRSDSERAVGSDLDYAYYVDQGRGPVVVKSAKTLHWEYPRPSGEDFFAKKVSATKGIHFIQATKDYLESQHYGL